MKVKFDITPLPWQTDFLDLCDTTPRNNNFIVVLSGRQRAKSTSIQLQLLKDSITKVGTSIVVSPVNSQNRKIFLEMKNIVAGTPFLKYSNDSLMELSFINGSQILFLSAAMKDSLRGKTVTGEGNLYLDEAAFISDEVFEILLPTVQVFRANIILASTPFIRSGFFYDLYTRGVQGDPKVSLINFSDYDTSALLSEEQIADFKRTMSPTKFKNEVMGMFLDNDSGVFGDFTKVIKKPSNEDRLFVGVDFCASLGNDDTAISIVNSNQEQVALFSFNNVEAARQPQHITNLLKPYLTRIQKVLAEKNSIGNVYCPLLKTELNNAGYKGSFETFNTSNSSKNKLVENLQVLIENNQVTLLDDPKQTLQLNSFESTINNKTKSISYGGSRNSHDDCVMALMLSLQASKRGGYNLSRI